MRVSDIKLTGVDVRWRGGSLWWRGRGLLLDTTSCSNNALLFAGTDDVYPELVECLITSWLLEINFSGQ